MLKETVQNSVRNLVGYFVGMTLGNRFTREEVTAIYYSTHEIEIPFSIFNRHSRRSAISLINLQIKPIKAQ